MESKTKTIELGVSKEIRTACELSISRKLGHMSFEITDLWFGPYDIELNYKDCTKEGSDSICCTHCLSYADIKTYLNIIFGNE